METRNAMVRKHAAFARRVAQRQARGRNITCPAALADLEQASLLGLDRAVQKWDPARGALLTIAGYECRAAVQAEIQRLKGKGSRLMPTIMSFDEARMAGPDPHAELEEQERVQERGRQLARLRAAVQELRPVERELFTRHFLEGTTQCSIAAERGVTGWAVGKRLKRIYARVAQELQA
jgi:RNA polymerase sigma factor (sigma-70 family)